MRIFKSITSSLQIVLPLSCCEQLRLLCVEMRFCSLVIFDRFKPFFLGISMRLRLLFQTLCRVLIQLFGASFPRLVAVPFVSVHELTPFGLKCFKARSGLHPFQLRGVVLRLSCTHSLRFRCLLCFCQFGFVFRFLERSFCCIIFQLFAVLGFLRFSQVSARFLESLDQLAFVRVPQLLELFF